MANRPRAVPRSPRLRREVDESLVQALEAKLEAEESGRYPMPAPAQAPPPSPEAPVSRPVRSAAPAPAPVQVQARKLASSQARQGTLAKPHVRRDGQATRGTTIHFPVDVHQQLRLAAAATDRRISDIVAEAVADWLEHNG